MRAALSAAVNGGAAVAASSGTEGTAPSAAAAAAAAMVTASEMAQTPNFKLYRVFDIACRVLKLLDDAEGPRARSTSFGSMIADQAA
jgi:hypothetical protein